MIVVAAVGLVCGGCSDDDGNEGDGRILFPDVSDAGNASDILADVPGEDVDGSVSDDASEDPDATSEDVSRPDIVESDAVEHADAFEGFDAGDDDGEIPSFTGSCEQVVDMGVLEPGTQTIEYTFEAGNDHIKTSCSPADGTDAEKVYQFATDQPLDVATSAGSNITVELRRAPCGQQASVVTCNPDGDLQKSLGAGETYYLLVEPEGVVAGDTVAFELEANSPLGGCTAGSTSCASTDTVEVCGNGGVTDQYTCPDQCDDQVGGCHGDTCATPIEVDGTKRIQGTLAAMTNQTTTYVGCTNSAQNGPVQAGGAEVVFELAGLTAGQVIDVDASGDAIGNTILIQRAGCGAQASCVVADQSGQETAEFTVDMAGDYTVIVETPAEATGSFDYDVSLQ